MIQRSICVLLTFSVGIFALIGLQASRPAHSDESSVSPKPSTAAQPSEFSGWPQPDAVLFVTGQQHGYIEPCGCTGLENQKGGLARRASLLAQLREQRGWTVVPIDAGNLVRRIGPQPQQKYQHTVKALRRMGYQAVGFGPDDLRLSFTDLLQVVIDSTDEQDKSDLFVSANADLLEFVHPYRVVEANGIRIGVTSVLSDEAAKQIANADIATLPAIDALERVLAAMRNDRCQLTVVMAQMTEEQCRQLAGRVRGIDLLVSADGTGEPRFQPEPVGRTSLIKAGSKGMYVGVVGLYQQPGGQTPQIRYQRITLDARFPDAPWVLENMAAYQRVLQHLVADGQFQNLGIKPTPHIRGTFVGSETCGDCHTQAYAKWEQTPHYHATTSISEPTERSDIPRHYDPECLSCHVTGWAPQQYRPYLSGYLSLEKTPQMTGNGCENCHGPGKNHVDAENGDVDVTEAELLKLRRAMRLELKDAEKACMECHDLDNSPDFHQAGAFEEYWQAIEHPWRD